MDAQMKRQIKLCNILGPEKNLVNLKNSFDTTPEKF